METNFPKWYGKLDDDQRRVIDRQFAALPPEEHEAERRRMATMAAVAYEHQLDPRQVNENWDHVRGQLAARFAEQAKDDPMLADKVARFATEEGLNEHYRELAVHRTNERGLLEGLEDDEASQRASLHDKMSRAGVRDVGWRKVYRRWEDDARNKPGFNPKNQAAYYLMAAEIYRNTQTRLSSVLPAAREAFASIKKDEDLEDVSERVMTQLNAYRPQDRRDFLTALRILAEESPDQRKATFWRNLRKSTDRSASSLGRGLGDVFTGAWNLSRIGFATVLPGVTIDEEVARVDRQRAEHNLESDIRRIQEESYSPVKDVLGDTIIPTWVERGLYAAPGALMTTAVAMIPYAGPALAFGAISADAYEQQRFRLIDAGWDDERASNRAMLLAPVIALPQALIERLGGTKVLGQIPGVKKVLTRFGDKLGRGMVRASAGMAGRTANEWTEEQLQNFVPLLVDDLAAALDDDMPDVVWRNGKDGALDGWWGQSGETLIAVLPIAIKGKSKSGRQRAEALGRATDLQLRAWGAQTADIEAFRAAEARGLSSAEEAADLLIAQRDGNSEAANAATQELVEHERQQMLQQTVELEADLRETGVQRLRRQGEGWTLEMADGQRVQVDSSAAAESLVRDLKLASSMEEAHQFVALMNQWHDSGPAGTERETTLSREMALGNSEGITLSEDGQVTRRITDAESVRALHEEARLRAGAAGNADIDVVVNGANDFVERVANGARQVIQRLQIFGSHTDSAMATFIHESLESNWRVGLRNGLFTPAETQAALAAAAQNLNPALAQNEEFMGQLQRATSGEATETEVRETLAELAAADVIGRMKSGAEIQAGSIVASLDAAIRTASDPLQAKALGRVRTFFQSVRAWFRGVFGTVDAVAQARRDGRLGMESAGTAPMDQTTLEGGVVRSSQHETDTHSPIPAWQGFMDQLLGLEGAVGSPAADARTGASTDTELHAIAEAEVQAGLTFRLSARRQIPLTEVAQALAQANPSPGWAELPALSADQHTNLETLSGAKLPAMARRAVPVEALKPRQHTYLLEGEQPLTAADIAALPDILHSTGASLVSHYREGKPARISSVRYWNGAYYHVQEVIKGGELVVSSVRKASTASAPSDADAALRAARKRLTFELGETISFGSYLRARKGEAPAGMFDPHAHHILFKKGLRGQEDLVERGQDLLWRYDIDPVLGLENLVWAPLSVSEQHGKAALEVVVETLERTAKRRGSRSNIREKLIDDLLRLGEIAANRQ